MSQHEKDLYNWIQENYDLGRHNPRVTTDYSLEVPARTYLSRSDSSTSIDINPRRIHQGQESFLKNNSKYPQSENPRNRQGYNRQGYIYKGLSQNTDSNQVGLLDFIFGHELGHVLQTSKNLLPDDDPRKIKYNLLDEQIPQTQEGKADLMSLAFLKAKNKKFPFTVKFPKDTAGFHLTEQQIALFRKNRKP